MSKLTFIRHALSSVLAMVVATCFVVLSAGTASAQNDSHKITICHKGNTISVDFHAVPAHLDHGDVIGECGQPPLCACSEEFDPVSCGGKVYANECLARCAGCTGPFEELCVCSDIFNPVTCNGVVYANICAAHCAGCTNAQLVCACGLIYAPVRCADGKIYVNACVALCEGATGCTPLQ